MIRTHFTGAPTRRLAVVEIQRNKARLGHLGVIRDGGNFPNRESAVAWTTVSDETPESTGNFLASVIADQNAARTQTPGTLAYTPANTTPPQPVAPWNSWLQPNCQPPNTAAPATPTAQIAGTAGSGVNGWVILAAIVGGIASLKALWGSDTKERR
jgi:hypothetical protein